MHRLMVEVKFLGQTCFLITSKTASVIFDPLFLSESKRKSLNVDVVLLSSEPEEIDNLGFGKEKQEPFVIYGPGEYEISKVTITGLPAQARLADDHNGQTTIYQLTANGLTFSHLGSIGRKLNQQQLEVVGGADVLMVPIGDSTGLTVSDAVEVVAQVEPKIVLPMVSDEKDSQNALGKFLAEIGKNQINDLSKLALSTERLPEEMQVVVLTPVS